MIRSRWIALAVALVVVGAAFHAYRRSRSDGAGATPAQQTAVVERGSLEKTVSSTGNLVSGAEVSVAFGTSGTVADVPAVVGDAVEAGQLLAVLETRDLELKQTMAQAALRSATTALASARAGLVDLQDGPDAATVEEARLQVEQAKDRLWGVQAQRDSTCGKVEHGMGEQAQCDSAQSSVLASEGSVRSAEIAYERVVAGATETELSAARDKVAQAEAQVTSAQAEVDQARLDLEESRLVAPLAGTVTAASITVGQMASAEQAVITVSDLTNLEVVVSVAESDVSDVAVGQTARVTLDAFPGKQLSAKVTAVAPTASVQSGVVLFPVTVRLDPTDVAARPGMTANVDIRTVGAENVLLVPSRAVITTDEGTFVLRVRTAGGAAAQDPSAARSAGAPGASRGRWRASGAVGGAGAAAGLASTERVAVTLGVSDGEYAEVTDGLGEGDVILVASTGAGTSDATFRGRDDGGMMMMPPGGFPGDRP